jgi:soluble lytic murein transglycosylase
MQRALCLKALGRPAVALPEFRELETAFESIPDYLAFWQAECLEGMGFPDSAAASYDRVAGAGKSSSLHDEAVLRAARLYREEGNTRSAAGQLRELLGTSNREPEALLGLADALESAGDSTQARSIRVRLIRDHPESAQALSGLEGLGEARSARELFYAGRVQASHDNTRKASRLFRRVFQVSQNDTWRGRAQYELGKVYFDRGDYRTASRALKRAHDGYRVPRALFEMARCSVKLGRDRVAAEQYLAFATKYPRLSGAAEAYWNAAMAYERSGRRKQAREVFLRLAARYPKSEFADNGRWRAGYALYSAGTYQKAARAFLDLAAHTSEEYLRDQGFYWAGKALMKAGKEDEGKVWIRRAAEGFPVSYYSSRARAVTGEENGRYPRVAKPRPGLLEQDYERSDYMVKGDALASLGLYREAEREYARARWAHQDDLFALGDLLQRLERIGSMNQALKVSNLMASIEREQGIPVTLASFRRLYPTYYWGEINRSAQSVGLDPNLVLAVIRQESAFDHTALSSAGARGLMQLMPATGRTLARRTRMRRFSEEDLWQPRTSIQLGTRHLSDHLRHFSGHDGQRLSLALSAYNAGLKAARRWSRRLRAADVDEFVESIPYRETRNYVKLVYRNYQVYSYLQSENGKG